VWICQISQEISQKRTRERMSDQEAKEIKSRSQRDHASAFFSQLQINHSLLPTWNWMAAMVTRGLELLDSIRTSLAIASMCVQPEVSHRPFIGEVVQALKLVCNEFDEIREMASRSYSRDDDLVGICPYHK
ncbi:hypothetical protein Tco_0219145, partial [Tanacetum coccineum]